MDATRRARERALQSLKQLQAEAAASTRPQPEPPSPPSPVPNPLTPNHFAPNWLRSANPLRKPGTDPNFRAAVHGHSPSVPVAREIRPAIPDRTASGVTLLYSYFHA